MRQNRVQLRLYIEGIRIPVVAATVSGGTNAPATAAIQILPDPAALDLPARSLVHLYFYDFGVPDEKSYDNLDIEDENEGYKLLFWGDLVMVQHDQTPSNHNMVIQCVGVSSYWDHAKQYFKDGGALSSATAKRMAFLGTDVIQYDGETSSSPASSVIRLLTSKPVSNPDLQGLLGGCVHLLEGIGGIYKGPKRFKGLNDFFAAAELRLKLSQNIWASIKDDTSTKMFKADDFKKWLTQAIRSKGGMLSFGEILNIVLAAIHHEYHSMLAPHFKKAATKPIAPEDKTERKPKVADSKYFPRLSIGPQYDLLNSASSRVMIINTIKQRIETLEKFIDAINPTRVVNLVGEALTGYYWWQTAVKNSLQVALATAYKVEETIKRYETETSKISDKHWGPGADLLNQAFLADQTGMENAGRALRELQNITIINPDLESKIEQGAISKVVAFIAPSLELLNDALKNYKSLIKYSGGGGKGSHLAYDALDRLVYQILTPQLYFVAPPTCNVIFPEQRTAMSYTRDFLAEVTRLQLTMHDRAQEAYSYEPFGSNKHVYYAPNVQDTLSKRLLSDTQKGTRVLMPHEIHSGIIPDLQQLAGVNIFVPNDGSSSGYLQRVANFTFFKSRFASRALSLTSGFNPYLAVGFTALVIDKALPLSRSELAMLGTPEGLDKMRGQRLEKIHKSIAAGEWDIDIIDSIRMPTHYFGQLRAIRHTLSPGGAHTQVALSFCRTHDEKVEFLGADDEIKKKVIASGKEVLGTASTGIDEYEYEEYDITSDHYDTVNLDSDVLTPEMAASINKPWYGVTSTDPLANMNDTSYDQAPKKPPDGVESKTGKWVRDDSIPPDGKLYIRQRSSLDNLAGELREATPYEYETFVKKHGEDALKGWRYEKQWQKYETYKVKVPAEQALMPAWFADIYKNENIGPQFYQDCLGIGSIMDAYELSFAANSPIKLDFGGARSEIERAISDPGNSLPVNRDLTAMSREAVVEVDDIEHAVNVITMLYSAAKEEGVDVDKFIRDFTYRPIANMVDMFGEDGIGTVEPSTIGVDTAASNYVTPETAAFNPTTSTGFHQKAFSAVGDMFGLVPADPTSIVSGTKLSPDLEIDKRVDPRPERHRAVMRYFQRLLLNKAVEQ